MGNFKFKQPSTILGYNQASYFHYNWSRVQYILEVITTVHKMHVRPEDIRHKSKALQGKWIHK